MVALLHGVRVLSLAINLPGPLAANRLRELGATVTKVEPPSGDPLAAAAPSWYAEITQGQEVMVLDLKSPPERTQLDELLTETDILLTANRPSALRRLGVLESASAVNPRLSHIEIVGYDGELEETPGHDLTYQAAYGTVHAPNLPLVPVADLLGAERAVSGALEALLALAQSGAGVHRRIVLDAAAADAGAARRHGLTGPGAPLGGATPTYSIYASSDGHVALGALEATFRDRTLDVLGTNHEHDEIATVFATRSSQEWEIIAAEQGIPLVAIRDNRKQPA